ncbi:MAG: sugar ABC transporter substrate-binding protein [Clostridiales bacterium]|nr:sugar ABC transporter substrate-binding protein [Clostridiales bacterium]
MKKRLLAVGLSCCLAAVAFLAGCGGNTGGASPAGGASPTGGASSAGGNTPAAPASGNGPYNIGVNTWGAGVPILDSFGDGAESSLHALGNTTVRASDDFTADKELANVQNFASSGVDGMVLSAAAVTPLPQIAQTCADAKIPFVLQTFVGAEDVLATLADNNPYYVGAVDSDLVYDGQVIGQKALDDGNKTALIIGGNIGDNNMDQRIQGFKEVFEKGGGKVLFEARCTDPSESATKAEDMISANKDANCLYALAGDYIPGSLDAIDKFGLSGKMNVYMSCIDATSAQSIKDGKIKLGNDGITLASYIAPTLLQNYLDGNKILDSNGKAPRFHTKPFLVTADNVDAYLSVFYNKATPTFTEDMLKNLVVADNPNASYQTYVDLIQSGLTLDAILKAHGLPTTGASAS